MQTQYHDRYYHTMTILVKSEADVLVFSPAMTPLIYASPNKRYFSTPDSKPSTLLNTYGTFPPGIITTPSPFSASSGPKPICPSLVTINLRRSLAWRTNSSNSWTTSLHDLDKATCEDKNHSSQASYALPYLRDPCGYLIEVKPPLRAFSNARSRWLSDGLSRGDEFTKARRPVSRRHSLMIVLPRGVEPGEMEG